MKKIIAGAALALAATAANAEFGVGITQNTYSNSGIKNELGFKATAGSSLYGFGTYEEPEVNGYDVELIGVGAGAKAGLSDSFALFVEGGYYFADEEKGAPYGLKDDFGGRVGVSVAPMEHIEFTGGYKFLSLDVKDSNLSNKFNGFELGVNFVF